MKLKDFHIKTCHFKTFCVNCLCSRVLFLGNHLGDRNLPFSKLFYWCYRRTFKNFKTINILTDTKNFQSENVTEFCTRSYFYFLTVFDDCKEFVGSNFSVLLLLLSIRKKISVSYDFPEKEYQIRKK